MKLRAMSYKRFAILMVAAALAVCLTLGFVTAGYLKSIALNDLAKVDAKKSTQFVFEALYSGMEKGWNKEDMTRIIKRLNGIEPGMTIKAHRSQAVAAQFGEIAEDSQARVDDPLIKKAMLGDEVFLLQDQSVRYIYPIKVKNECLSCHHNVKDGDINGVIDIVYPADKLKISLSFVLNYFMLFFGLLLLASFWFFYINLSRFLIKPLNNLVDVIKNILTRHDLDKRVDVDTEIAEVNNLGSSFNKLLDYVKTYNQQQKEQYYRDSLTDLPNRLRLLEDIKSEESASLVLLNIDSFKEVNDFYGVNVGDFILVELACRLRHTVSCEYEIYRFAGDEYAILMPDINDDETLENFMRELVATVKREIFMYDDYEISVDVTAGAARGNGNVVEHADMALKLAKKNKKNCIVFDPSFGLSKQYEKNIVWSKRIKEAIDMDRIVPFYQPIVDNERKVVGKYECLVRLINDEGKPISPYLFLDVAKKAKIYTYITKIVIERAFHAFENLDYEFSVNLSVEDIQDPILCDYIYSKLQTFAKPRNVVFELTESEGIENFEEVVSFISRVKTYGAKIAIDDFGTGYSNFAYILKLDVDYIKIDASMIKNVDTDRSSEVIVATIVDFCAKMGIKTIAEYVHNESVSKKVISLGVDYSQGYYFGEPTQNVDKIELKDKF